MITFAADLLVFCWLVLLVGLLLGSSRTLISGIFSFDFFNFELDFFFTVVAELLPEVVERFFFFMVDELLFFNSEFDKSDSLILVFLVWDNSFVHPVGWRSPALPID